MSIKPDSLQIETFVDVLEQEPWIVQTPSRRWWPKYLFHFTDLKNAVKIISSDKFLSRAVLQSTQSLPIDIADPNVIQNTANSILQNVRLYFRPLTNMQWNIEGFAPGKTNKHCPVPIVFLLDSKSILTKTGVRFSDGNLGSTNANIGSDYNFLSALPFEKIYHDSSLWGLAQADANKIKYHRHAEVIVPNELSTNYVKNIWCRTPAEHQTLLKLLPNDSVRKWGKKIGVGPQYQLFHRVWNFVEEASLDQEHTTLKFHRHGNPTNHGPFNLKISFTAVNDPFAPLFTWEQTNYMLPEFLKIPIFNIPFKDAYRIELTLDGHTACVATFDSTDLFF